MSQSKFRKLGDEAGVGVLIPTSQLPATAQKLLPQDFTLRSPLATQLADRKAQESDVIAEVNLRLRKEGEGVTLAIADSGISEEEMLAILKYAGDACCARIASRTSKPN